MSPSPDLDDFIAQFLVPPPPGLATTASPPQPAIPEPDPRQTQPEPLPASVPPLPEALSTIDTSLPLGGIIDTYTNYAAARSPMTPRLFHESAAIWLAAVAIARRLFVYTAFGPLYPNLSFVWIARSTVYGKTTALNLAVELGRRAFRHLFAAQDSTVEALIADMAGSEPPNMEALQGADLEAWRAARNFAAQRAWVNDELSGLLASAGKDYNGGLIECLLRFLDCDEDYTRSTRQQGRVTVRNAYLSMIGASTPAAMARYMKPAELWEKGWWGRFAVLTPEGGLPPWRTAVAAPEPPEVLRALGRLYSRLPAPVWPAPVIAQRVPLSAEAEALWNRYTQAMRHDLPSNPALFDSRLDPSYGRLPAHALRLATILAALEWPEGRAVPEISHDQMRRALACSERWRASVHRALNTLSTTGSDQLQERVLASITRAGEDGITRRDLCRAVRGVRVEDLMDALSKLILKNEVEPITAQQRGRPTERYRLSRE